MPTLAQGFLGPPPPMVARGGDWGWYHWLWLFIPIVVYLMICFTLFAFGRSEHKGGWKFFFQQIDNSLERATGFPGWAMAGSLSGLMALLIAVIGFYWDVAWHVDFGRDTVLFTPSHVMILVGFGMLGWAAMISVLFASIDEAETALRIGPNRGIRIPMSAILMAFFAIGGVTAFPFDALWHQAYGVDVTLWSPTHIMLVAGGSFATLACWLMIAEVRKFSKPNMLGRGIYALAAGATLAGLSTLQGEFDFGVSQYQALYLPVMIAVAAGFGLVLARIALGPYGTFKAIIAYTVVRGFVSFVAIGGGLHHTTPLFPFYIVSACVVEGVAYWLGTENRLKFAAVAGVGVGTIGMMGDFMILAAMHGWTQSMPTEMLVKALVLGPIGAVAAGALAAGFSQSAFHFDTVKTKVPVAVMALAGAAVFGVLAYPLPRKVGNVHADITVEKVANGSQAYVGVKLTPADAAENARVFGVGSWQGGGVRSATLVPVEGKPGEYRTDKTMPITAPWKTLVALQRNDEMMSAPVYMPVDPGIGFAGRPAIDRSVDFVRNTTLLLPETRPGDPTVRTLSWGVLVVVIGIWVALVVRTTKWIPRLAEMQAAKVAAAPPTPKNPVRPAPRPYAPQGIGRWS